MWMCERCKATFEEPDIFHNGGGDWGENWFVCPECGHDSICECGICKDCGAPVPDESGDCICDRCLHFRLTPADALEYGAVRKEAVQVNGFLCRVFIADQINEILLDYYCNTAGSSIGGIMETMRRDGLAEQYLSEDLYDYKEFLLRRK